MVRGGKKTRASRQKQPGGYDVKHVGGEQPVFKHVKHNLDISGAKRFSD